MKARDFLLGEVASVEEALRAAERALAEAADGKRTGPWRGPT